MDLLIVGASVRAAAFSALRAGFSPGAVDLFVDRDLAAVAPCVRVGLAGYPAGLIAAAETLPPCPWVYTGGLENHPELVERLSRSRPLLGNPPEVLRAVRDPVRVFEALSAAGIPAVPVALDARGVPADGAWLRKPLGSTGGTGVGVFDGSGGNGGCYFQKRVRGLDASAVFLGRGDGAALKGVTRQLIGRPGAEFGYRGSVGPWPVELKVERRIAGIGGALARAFGLVGLFGADFILEGDRAWVVEVNPRYSASVEVLELALGAAWLGEHRDACDADPSDSSRKVRFLDRPRPSPSARRCVAKEVLFADSEITAGPIEVSVPTRFEVPEAADIPEPGTRFAPGEPILTVFGQGPTADAATADLGANTAKWRRRLGLN